MPVLFSPRLICRDTHISLRLRSAIPVANLRPSGAICKAGSESVSQVSPDSTRGAHHLSLVTSDCQIWLEDPGGSRESSDLGAIAAFVKFRPWVTRSTGCCSNVTRSRVAVSDLMCRAPVGHEQTMRLIIRFRSCVVAPSSWVFQAWRDQLAVRFPRSRSFGAMHRPLLFHQVLFPWFFFLFALVASFAYVRGVFALQGTLC